MTKLTKKQETEKHLRDEYGKCARILTSKHVFTNAALSQTPRHHTFKSTIHHDL